MFMLRQTVISLPEGYTFADQSAITGEDIVGLRVASNRNTENRTAIWDKVLGQSLATVGVRNETEALVGVGFLAGNIRHGLLADLLVHPEYRGNGIGFAILEKRLAIADDMEIPYVYTELAASNVLQSMYEELGFTVTGRTWTRGLAETHKQD
jgi:GNAT superfamily N-acetyltransferase